MKVFSLEKFIEDCRDVGESENDIKRFVKHWARECDGLTELEMSQKNLATEPDWMVEKEDLK